MGTGAGTAVLPELDCGHEPWTRSYWLSNCEGYSVESSRGRIGYVEEVVFTAAGDRPVAFRIRTTSGRDLVRLSVEHVRAISPALEEILVEEAWSVGLAPGIGSRPEMSGG